MATDSTKLAQEVNEAIAEFLGGDRSRWDALTVRFEEMQAELKRLFPDKEVPDGATTPDQT